MTQDEAFLQAIWEDLSDDTPWLVYADWLEERGDPRAVLYRNRRLTNSIGMQFVLIPPGKFLMGSPETEAERHSGEGPQHEVEITRPFYLGVYPVTQAEYEKVMGKNPSWFSASGAGKDEVKKLDTRRFPVECVSWDDATAFCRLLTETESGLGRLYRLPTEAEWEYACRGGPVLSKAFLPFCFERPTASLSSTQANFNGYFPYGGASREPEPSLGPRTIQVGSYQPNPLGLWDMHGNVWEWCADWYQENYYWHSPQRDPQGPESSSENRRVLRGGSWVGDGWLCRAANRNKAAPFMTTGDYGFRVVLVGARAL
jgi:uncharacterized protein (TIGR02996 family)